jgi:hypothetical protein
MSACTLLTLILDQTLRAPRRKALKIVLIVKTFLLSIDPAPTQRNLHRFGVSDTGLVGASLGDLEPEAIGSRVILLQPGLEGFGALEQVGASSSGMMDLTVGITWTYAT